MNDRILEQFFSIDRWTKAIDKGVGKDIRRDQLIKLCSEQTRLDMYQAIKEGRYMIAPPHTAQIPKENGEFRTVYVNEPIDRVVLSIANDLLFDLCPHMIHPSCKSYQTGIGCGKVVKEASSRIAQAESGTVLGWKSDLYMDGEYVATAKNSGCGGSTDIHYVNGINSAEAQRLEEYAKTHPVVFYYQGEEYKFYGVDHIVDTLFDSWMEKQ